jgi:ubiquinone/menaquinone biosynthesis C-methylase UbiE
MTYPWRKRCGLRLSFDRIADRYDETRAYPAGVPERIVEGLSEYFPRGSRILDIGVGTGRLAAPMQAFGFDVVGVDLSRGMLAKAKEKGVRRLLLADARELPFRDGSFVGSISVHVTHLIEEWPRAVAEIGRVTNERYASVVTVREGCQLEELQRAYDAVCLELGCEIKHPGLKEMELAQHISPAAELKITDRRDAVSVKDALERYRSRMYSDIWDVPDEVHENAMRHLEEVYGAFECLERRERISLVVWDVGSIREFTDRISFACP